ncbi:hypothetical protein EBH_0047790 [Eimeria brunetti]|uniref:SAG family member n=1 Tax=Eimeria brunetti TaxID=51314 RepID=U6LD09_9EIME|nr:hypothetical protein EBH_0047790 [Eimeria brunetti]
MVPLYGTAAAVCLVALYGLRSVAAQQQAGQQTTYKLKVQEVTEVIAALLSYPRLLYLFACVVFGEDAYLAVNLARNGKLPVRIKEVSEDKDLVAELEETVEPGGDEARGAEIDSESCKTLINSATFKEMFRQAFDYPTDTDATPNYRQMLQKALDEGLTLFSEDYFTGLIARTTQLEDMTDEDLKAPTNDGAAAAAVPTILLAGLGAMLTAISA